MLALILGQALVADAAGGPTKRRRGKDNELDISLVEGAAPGAEGEPEFGARDGRNLANVFPFVGGDRGE